MSKVPSITRRWLPVVMPVRWLSWPSSTSSAAPVTKPVMTAAETKRVSPPRRSRPMTSWIAPTRKVSVTIRATRSLDSVKGASVLATTTARALVGPVVMSVALPNRLATIVETMAV